MNEQLQGKLVEILSAIQDAAKATGDFAMRELPDVAQSYVTYGRASSILWLLIGVALMYTTYRLIMAGVKAPSPSGMELVASIGGPITGISGAVIIGFSLNNALLVWFAPKVWLLKEIASLIK